MLVIAEMVSFIRKGFHNLLSVLEDVDCTDCIAGYGRKIFNLLFTLVHHGQLLVASSVFSYLY